MCGIVGYIGKNQAAPILLEGLSKLEYRGYDSAGIAVYNNNELEVAKSKGKLAVLSEKIDGGKKLSGNMGIGHTRWATHGEPSVVNAHPHYSNDKKIAIVHNGIIENYLEIKERLTNKGFTFVSQTDTEVLAQLLDYYYMGESAGDPLDAIARTMLHVRGSYALGVLFADEPGTIYAARKGLRTGIVADRLGGQVNETADIENFTSILKTDGTALAGNFTAHLKSYDIDIITPHSVAKIEREGDMWRLVLENGSELRSKTIIAASGARWKQLEVPGEEEFKGRGVAYCPHCDGPLFKGKRVAVVGGGNSGVEAAIDLAGIASSVVLLQRGSELTADKVLQEKLLSLPNVTVKYRASTSKLTGSNKLEKLFYLNRETGETESIDVDGCFVQIGLKPNTEWLDGAVELNAYGEVAVSDRCTTSAPGLFAAGDCTSVPYKQIVIALGEGAKASLSAFDYLIRQGA